MTKYRQKPITAIQWAGDNIEEIKNFVASANLATNEVDPCFLAVMDCSKGMTSCLLEVMDCSRGMTLATLSKGDFLIKELDGKCSSMTEKSFLNEYVKEVKESEYSGFSSNEIRIVC